MENRTKGLAAEEIARTWLETQGYKTIARNWRFGKGEIDLIMSSHEQQLVFVEVKQRPLSWPVHQCFPSQKQVRTLMETATIFMQKHPFYEKARFDFVLLRGQLDPPHLEHFEGAIG